MQCSGLLFLDDGENAKWLAQLSDVVLQKNDGSALAPETSKRITVTKTLKERGWRVRGQKDKVEVE